MQLSIIIRGDVTSSNFDIWKQDLLQKIKMIDSELVTDAQFARAQEDVKAFKSAERTLKEAKAKALEQVATIHSLFSAIDEVTAQAREARLSLERQIRGRKEEIKREFVQLGVDTIKKYLALQSWEFQKIDHSPYLDRARFAAAIKGKATINTLNTALSKKCDQIKHAIDLKANTVARNLATLHALPIEHQNLLQDQGALLDLTPEDLDDVISDRISVYQESRPLTDAPLEAIENPAPDVEQSDANEDSREETQIAADEEGTLSLTEAIAILSAVRAGCDPDTGEILPESSSLRNPRLVAALRLAISALRNKPDMAYEKWATEEEERLVAAFNGGLSMAELARQHMRTRGAIRARLVRLGLMSAIETTSRGSQAEESTGEASAFASEGAPRKSPQLDISAEFLDAVIATCMNSTEDEVLDCAYPAMEQAREVTGNGAMELPETLLKQVAKINDYVLAAEELKLALQDIPYVLDQTAADELIAWLQEIAAPLDQESILFRRIDKEARELLERRSELPTGAEREISQQLVSAHRQIQNQAPTCEFRGCQQKMTLRDGKYGLFWGCVTFPKCWGTKNLSKGQLAFLPN